MNKHLIVKIITIFLREGIYNKCRALTAIIFLYFLAIKSKFNLETDHI